MKIKRILSLAVVLAMVMAVVPMFGLTASAAEELTPTTTKVALKKFGPYTGTVNISFDLTYHFGDNYTLKTASDIVGNHFIGLGLSVSGIESDDAYLPSFGESAIGIQGHDKPGESSPQPHNGYVGFRGNTTLEDKKEYAGDFIPVSGTKYHVEITANMSAHTYSEKVTQDGSDAVVSEETNIPFRKNWDALDTLMMFDNGSPGNCHDWATIENFTANGDDYDYQGEVANELTGKNKIPWVKAGTKKNLIFNGDFSHGLQGWAAGDSKVMTSANFEVVDTDGDHNQVLKIKKSGSSSGETGIGAKWAIKGGKSYVLTFDGKNTENATINAGIKFMDKSNAEIGNITAEKNIISENLGIATGNEAGKGICETGSYQIKLKNTWETHQWMVTAPENAVAIKFNMGWAGTNTTSIDNFSLYEIERIPTTVKVNFQSSDGQPIGTPETISDLYVGDSFTYGVENANKVKHFDDTYYVYESGTDTIGFLEKENNELTLKYKKASIVGYTKPENVETRVGIEPTLPETIEVQFEGDVKTAVAVQWDADSIRTAIESKGQKTVTGKVEGYDPKVEITVDVKEPKDYIIAYYAFDDANDLTKDSSGKDKKGLKAENVTSVEGVAGNAIKTVGGDKNKSYFQMADNVLEANGKTTDNFTVSMWINREEQGNSFAMILHAQSTQKKNTEAHLGLINRGPGDGNALNFEYRNNGQTQKVVESKTYTVPKNWEHIAISSNGDAGTASLYLNGELVASAEGITVKPSDLKAQNNFLGLSSWPDNDYAAMYDEVKFYSVALTKDEIVAEAGGFTDKSVKLMDDTQVGTYTKRAGNDVKTLTVPRGVYAGQYYLDDYSEAVPVNSGEVEVGKLDKFTWQLSANSAQYVGDYNTYNCVNIEKWDSPTSDFEAYAYVDVPEKTDKQQYVITIEGKWPYGIDSMNHGGGKVELVTDSADTVKDIDLSKGTETAENLKALKTETINESYPFNPSDYDGGEKTGTEKIVVPVNSSMKQGEAVIKFTGNVRGVSRINSVTVTAEDIAPAKPVAELGYEDNAFTINLKYGEGVTGDTIKVHADASGSAEEFNESAKTTDGITLKTNATNRNYTVTAVNGKAESEALVTSIYELVVKAVAAETGDMKADKLAAANKVIAEGGIIDVDSIAEDGVRNQIMQKIESQDVTGIEIIETIFNKGIGFVVSEGKIYVGSDPETAANVTTSGDGVNGVYRYMKIDGQNVTLSNDSTFASTADAVTLSLDSVNIEFVETIIEEAGADGADADVALIPEL